MSDGMGREPAYLSSHATNRYFIPNWGICSFQSYWLTLSTPAAEDHCESFLTHDHTCRKAAFCAQEKIVGSRPPNRVRNCVTDLEKTDR